MRVGEDGAFGPETAAPSSQAPWLGMREGDERPAIKKVREAVEQVEKALKDAALSIEEDLPSDVRYKLMVCACSLNDYLLWIEELDEQGDYGNRWRCHEIESGTHQDGDHAAEAVYRYFGADAFRRVEARPDHAEPTADKPCPDPKREGQ